eukprot:Plantae.Rhodophyta-Rhodochaete_pulchella.ctg11749.p1 GENE.Plantae.Rhodophyta-Rhodochaete_pulchella.ctg11749~~Plantae.Rhodophyta-Rhodochaete_pulchella.ctg11749.p1  ORF type:complete len:205 (-),score=16.63 Plantae.Rhodophyta-Rhodochaete_pulchella.ctg11749:1205-1819(-)
MCLQPPLRLRRQWLLRPTRQLPRLRKQRGTNYSPADMLSLARARVKVSLKVDEQDDTRFWDNVAKEFVLMKSVDQDERPPTSSKSQWCSLLRNVQKLLACDSKYGASIASGETEEETMANIMELYCSTTGGRDEHWYPKRVPALKCWEAVQFLKTQPKFSSKCRGVKPRDKHQTTRIHSQSQSPFGDSHGTGVNLISQWRSLPR